MKCSTKAIFMLPYLTHQELLPDPSLSIKVLTSFLLPSQQPNPTKELSVLSQIFSKDVPSTLSAASFPGPTSRLILMYRDEEE